MLCGCQLKYRSVRPTRIENAGLVLKEKVVVEIIGI